MFVPPPRHNNLARHYGGPVGQPPTPQPRVETPTPGPKLTDNDLLKLRKIIREEVTSGGEHIQTEPAKSQTGWAAFWTGMWKWLQGASGELLTAGATVFITLYAREMYATARVPGQQPAHIALDLATPQADFEKMTVQELDTQADTLIADFYAEDPPSDLLIGERLQLVIEQLLNKKLAALQIINQAFEEAKSDGDKAIAERERTRGRVLADEIEGLEEDWEEVTENVGNLIKEHKSIDKFRDLDKG